VHSCTHWLSGDPASPTAPLPPHLGFLYKGAIGQQIWTTSQRDSLVSYLYFPCSQFPLYFPYTSSSYLTFTSRVSVPSVLALQAFPQCISNVQYPLSGTFQFLLPCSYLVIPPYSTVTIIHAEFHYSSSVYLFKSPFPDFLLKLHHYFLFPFLVAL
jgi:hypothetical protein